MALSEMLTTELGAAERPLTISGENVARVKSDLSLPETDSLAADTLPAYARTWGVILSFSARISLWAMAPRFGWICEFRTRPQERWFLPLPDEEPKRG